MFSRITLRAGALTPLLRRPDVRQKALVCLARSTSNLPVSMEEQNKQMEEMMSNWEKANKLYYGPDRDTKNFPIPAQPEHHPSTRMGIFPESWFNLFYEKTGVTGPYLLGTGFITFLLSKEIWVVEHGMTEFIAFWGMIYIIGSKFGPKISNFLDEKSQIYKAKRWTEPLNKTKLQLDEAVAEAEKNIWRQDGQKYLFEAKKENVELQLEEEYRKRLSQIHVAVKKRLDYQADIESSEKRYEQRHMVNWIVKNVMKSITPQQEKDSITNCIANLKTLSAHA